MSDIRCNYCKSYLFGERVDYGRSTFTKTREPICDACHERENFLFAHPSAIRLLPRENFGARRPSNENKFVYLVFSSELELVKIGVTGDLKTRMQEIKRLSPNIGKLTVIHKILSDDAFELEKSLHNKYSSIRIDGEWFALSAKDIANVIEEFPQ